MSKRQNTETLNEVIKKLLSAYRLNDKFYRVASKIEWEKAMGAVVAKRTESFYFKDGKLVVKLTSSVLRNELSFAKEKIISTLNKALGERVIKELELR